MSVDTVDLLRVIDEAKGDCAKLGIPLDAEIICARYNAYREKLKRTFNYDIREMQAVLAELIRPADSEKPPTLNGSISHFNGKILKVVVFGESAPRK